MMVGENTTTRDYQIERKGESVGWDGGGDVCAHQSTAAVGFSCDS